MTRVPKLFVYGTLKPGECNWDKYCEGRVTEVIKAQTFGKLYDFPELGYPAMSEGDDVVRGYLLSFVDDSWQGPIDELEEYDPTLSLEENIYQRSKIEVYTDDGQPLGSSWGYSMLPSRIASLGGIEVKSGEWKPLTKYKGDFKLSQ
jgi:gamma-glutamylcyclotransferase (GGCT)/AIG2-like uncharacterized protein YtfP